MVACLWIYELQRTLSIIQWPLSSQWWEIKCLQHVESFIEQLTNGTAHTYTPLFFQTAINTVESLSVECLNNDKDAGKKSQDPGCCNILACLLVLTLRFYFFFVGHKFTDDRQAAKSLDCDHVETTGELLLKQIWLQQPVQNTSYNLERDFPYWHSLFKRILRPHKTQNMLISADLTCVLSLTQNACCFTRMFSPWRELTFLDLGSIGNTD